MISIHLATALGRSTSSFQARSLQLIGEWRNTQERTFRWRHGALPMDRADSRLESLADRMERLMSDSSITADDFLAISPRIRVMPIIHGSGEFAIQVREELLNRPYDCLAVPLPPSFQEEVEAAVEQLPAISVVVQVDARNRRRRCRDGDGIQLRADRSLPGGDRRPADGARRADRACVHRSRNAAVRAGRPVLSRSLRTQASEPRAIRGGTPGGCSAAGARPECPADRLDGGPASRTGGALSLDPLCLLDPRLALDTRCLPAATGTARPESFFTPIATYAVDPKTLIFALGELPYITGLYERGRRELLPDDNLSIDGVKEMVLDARERLKKKHPKIAQRITPQLLSVYFRYVRNLSLIDRRLTPDLYTLVVAAQQTAGDDFALALAETARSYPFDSVGDFAAQSAEFRGAGTGADGDRSGRAARLGHRADGQPPARTGRCRGAPASSGRGRSRRTRRRWRRRWDPFGMCSWPPEDDRIESFHRHVREQAKAILGADLARTEKFTTSVRDGIDIRETLQKLAHRRPVRQGGAPQPRVARGRRLPVRHPGRPPGLCQPDDLVCRACRGIDARLLRHRSHEEPGRAGDRPGAIRRRALHLSAAADS